jgi:hypothetical protein
MNPWCKGTEIYSRPLNDGIGNLPVRSATVHLDRCIVLTRVSREEGDEARRLDRRKDRGKMERGGSAGKSSSSKSSQSFKKAMRRRDLRERGAADKPRA